MVSNISPALRLVLSMKENMDLLGVEHKNIGDSFCWLLTT